METIVIIGAGASGLACMNELVKTNKYNIIVLEQSNKAQGGCMYGSARRPRS